MNRVFEAVVLMCSIVGLMSAVHLSTILVRSRVVSALEMTKIGTGGLLIVLILMMTAPPRTIFAFWMQTQVPLFMIVASSFLLAKQRDRRLVESFDEVLSNLIVRMKNGCSLQAGIAAIAEENRSSHRLRLLEVARSVAFSPQNDARNALHNGRIREIVRELCEVSRLNRSQIQELQRWRERIRRERSFRRRSVQATAQVRAQAIVLSVIYGLLAFFSVAVFGWSVSREPFQLSLPFFLLGLFLILRGGGRVKWSV
ncbi:MAG: hypothetical protein RBT63_06420 [Bdellovibrionales bacterium]|nr:hypothetical protein [Bdellovibrionales bacterium]